MKTASAPVVEKKLGFATWNYKIKVAIIGMWGHDAYTEEYTYSGCVGRYPIQTYRFTRFGTASVDKDKYLDLEIKSEDFHVGHLGLNFRILSITEAPF